MHRIRRHLNFANVVSVIALFVALGAGAYAAGLPSNSVTSKTIRNGEVSSVDVADRGLSARDIRLASLPGASGKTTIRRGNCMPLSSSFNPCAEAPEVKLGRPSKVFATGDVVADSGSPTQSTVDCALFVDGNQFGTDIDIDVAFADSALSVSGVTPKLGRGAHAFELDCKGPSNSSPRVFRASLSTIVLGRS